MRDEKSNAKHMPVKIGEPVSITINYPVIGVPNTYHFQCDCKEILVKAFSVETGTVYCSCGRAYKILTHNEIHYAQKSPRV